MKTQETYETLTPEDIDAMTNWIDKYNQELANPDWYDEFMWRDNYPADFDREDYKLERYEDRRGI